MSKAGAYNNIANPFNIENLILLTFSEKVLFTKYILTAEKNAFNKICKDKNLLCLKDDQNITAFDILQLHDKTVAQETLSVLLKNIFPDFQYDYDYSPFFEELFKTIPDLKMSEKNKMAFVKKYFPNAVATIHSLSYEECPTQLKYQALFTKINIEEYNTALKAPLDYSDFIILTNGLLQNLATKPMSSALKVRFRRIEENYFELDYIQCVTELNKIAEILRENGRLDKKTLDLISSASKTLVESQKEKSHSRRFYEVRLAQYAMGQFGQPRKLKSFNRFFNFLNHESVTNSNEAEKSWTLIIKILESYTEYLQRHDILKKQSLRYGAKDRIEREGFVGKAFEKPGEELGETSYSMNQGIMTANAPNFLDCLTKYPVRNKVGDIMKCTGSKEGYSSTEKRFRSPFVASVSGHSFFLIAMCEGYLNAQTQKLKGKISPEKIRQRLSSDINNIIVAYASLYITKGYHSFLEVLDALTEPQTVNQFKDRWHITIDPKIDARIFSLAMNDTLGYSKAICLKRAMEHELLSKIAKPTLPSIIHTSYTNEQKRNIAKRKREEQFRVELQLKQERDELQFKLEKQKAKIAGG